MNQQVNIDIIQSDVIEGFLAKPKFISSKYFYDSEGSKIFQDIMRMPQYYLTDCELNIFENQKQKILSSFVHWSNCFEMVELGAGDGLKTKILIDYFLRENINFKYIPIDISEGAVTNLKCDLRKNFPSLVLEEKVGDYFEMLQKLLSCDTPKIILFLGSNIGNFHRQESIDFLRNLRQNMNSYDLLFIGFDLKKDPEIIKAAYDDIHGHTERFNLNLLKRFNREYGANFKIEHFRHAPNYDPLTGAARSYLVSTEEQKVYFEAFDEEIHFNKWEAIYTEISQKFDYDLISYLAKESGFKVIQNFTDSQEYFVNSLWQTI